MIRPVSSSAILSAYDCYTRSPLFREALALPIDQRVTLAYRLVSVEPDPEAAWEAEIARRIARFDAGESQAIPASEVFNALSEIAPDR